MEFGIFNGLYVPESMTDGEGRRAEHRRLQEEVAWVKAADRAGFKYLWATEHHFLDEYSHLSANESFLGFCAAATERIHLGSGIFNVTPPVNHPARIAERVAILDHLSEGRFEFGMGRGSSTTEQAGFGIDDPDLTKDMFDEVVPQFRRMWAETDYSFDGKFFSMPPRGTSCRSRSPIRTRRCGWPPAARARSRRRPAWVSVCCASRPVRPRSSRH